MYDESTLEKYINHPKCVAVGECGLDYFRLPEDEEEKLANVKKQKEVFISQIEFAKKVKKPLIVPEEKLIIETDGPYLTPHPFRGKRNEPYYTVFVADKMAEILNKSRDEIENLTSKNAIKLFKEFSSLS